MNHSNPDAWKDQDELGKLMDEWRPVFVGLAFILLVAMILGASYLQWENILRKIWAHLPLIVACGAMICAAAAANHWDHVKAIKIGAITLCALTVLYLLFTYGEYVPAFR